MSEDRELETLIAEKVFGWQWFTYAERPHMRYFRHPKDFAYGIIEENGQRAHITLPHYTTDIAAAWRVVEEMRTQGWRFHLSEHGGAIWNCRFTPEDTSQYQYAVETTAPLAICRAALKALGIEA